MAAGITILRTIERKRQFLTSTADITVRVHLAGHTNLVGLGLSAGNRRTATATTGDRLDAQPVGARAGVVIVMHQDRIRTTNRQRQIAGLRRARPSSKRG